MLPSGLPDAVGSDEDLARFLVHRSQFNMQMVKPAAFLPNPKDGQTSVFRHGAEPAGRLWVLGALASGDRGLRGVAIIRAQAVTGAGLTVAAYEPPERHAAIEGWPHHADPATQKALQKQKASILASSAGRPTLRADDGENGEHVTAAE